MIRLPHGCYCSGIAGDPKKGIADTLSVYPENWNKKAASTKEDWYIQYYFHDPGFKEDLKYKYGKLKIIKGMNKCKNLQDRIDATAGLIDYELQLLKVQGYNPITKSYNAVFENEHEYEISPNTFFYTALDKAYKQFNPSGSTKVDMNSMMGRLKVAIQDLNLSNVFISDISRKHINYLLAHLERKHKKFSAHQHNKYRSYMMCLFKELYKIEAVEHNPMRDIDIKKTTRKVRLTLNREERDTINMVLHHKYYTFWRFLQIFFHSGSRETEMLALKKEDVDLAGQRFKVMVKKGRQYQEQWRTIKTSVVYLWQELLSGATADQYLFGEGLKPATRPQPIRREQITRRWYEHVKKKMNIKADFYSLKHTNLDETAELLSARDAANQAGHTTPVVTLNHYLVGEKARQHERLKNVNNSF